MHPAEGLIPIGGEFDRVEAAACLRARISVILADYVFREDVRRRPGQPVVGVGGATTRVIAGETVRAGPHCGMGLRLCHRIRPVGITGYEEE